MSRALVIAAAAVLTPVAVALAITNSDWFSSNSASAALLASDVRPAHPTVGTDASEAELGVAGGPLDCLPAGAGPEDSRPSLSPGRAATFPRNWRPISTWPAISLRGQLWRWPERSPATEA